MISVSTAWQRALYNDNRDYLEYIKITLANGTVLNLTNENIWGGIKIDDAVSNDSDFQIGAAIVNKLTFNINNLYDEFSSYDFNNALVEAKVGLVTDASTEIIKKGEFIVNQATYNGSLINIECYDYMSKFDAAYSTSTLTYPATLDLIVRDACTKCGVVLGTLNFPHKSFVVATKPDDASTTYREVISWCAQIAGCFARCNADGELELKWYSQSSIGDGSSLLNGGIFDDGTPNYTSGDTADGGSFNPWNTGYVHDAGTFTDRSGLHYISSVYSRSVSVDDVIITGVKITVKTDSSSSIHEETVGTAGYVIEISNNPMITTTNVSEIITWLGTQLIGFKFRKAQISHPSNPAIEAGDVAILVDLKGNLYPLVISHTIFTVGASQSTISSAQTPARNKSDRYSVQTKNYVEMRKAVDDEKSARQTVEAQLQSAINNSAGLYETSVTDQVTGKTTYYLHNKTVLNESNIRIMFSDAGITVTADSGQNWYGLTVSGTMLVNLLASTGIVADWINTGQLAVSKNGSEVFFVDCDEGVVRIVADSFSLSSGRSVDGAYSYADSQASAAQTAATNASKNYTDGKVTTINQAIDNIQAQIDGEVDFYYYDYVPTMNNVPASEWHDDSTTEDPDVTEQIRKSHEGDTFLHISTGQTYRFLKLSGTWQWQLIQDTGVSQAMQTAQNAMTEAQSKIRLFRSTTQNPTPTPPYEAGDIWVEGSTGDFLVCQTSKTASGDTYSRSDWVIATKYTDDSTFTTWMNGTFATTLTNLQNGIKDAKLQTWYQSNDPSSAWTSADLKLEHEGDIWYNSTSSVQKFYQWSGTAWREMKAEPPQDIMDEIDGKANIFVGTTTPVNPSSGDLWFKGTTEPIRTYVNGSWQEYNKYTDNSVLTNWLTNTYAVDKSGLQDQIDGKVGSYYQTSNPADSWSSSDYSKHTGDLWYNSTSSVQKYYRWTGSVWQEMTATPPDAVFDKIDGKAEVFVSLSVPTPPYHERDLWFASNSETNGEIYTCINTRTSGSGQASDWAVRNKYTDDSELNAYKSVVTDYVDNLQGQIDDQVDQWFIEEEPTANNYPASQWNTAALKEKHKDDLCYDKTTGKVYQYEQKVGGIEITFSSQCATESINYDWVQIFYQRDNKYYSLPKLGGSGSSNTLANAKVFVPSSSFWLHWRTDSSADSYYGFAIASVEGKYGNADGTQVQSLPTASSTQDVGSTLPESTHGSYGNNVSTLYKCTPSVTVPSDTYEWSEIQDEDIQTALNYASNAQDTADQKRRVFIAQPTPPYESGDLWTKGESGGIFRCKSGISRAEGAAYVASDWEVASNYIDDTALHDYVAEVTEGIEEQLDNRVEQYFINGEPSASTYPESTWSDDEKPSHANDLCYDKRTGKVYRYNEIRYNLKIKFSPNCATEHLNYDWVQIFYETSGKKYSTPKLAGTGVNNTIANAEVVIPTADFRLNWRTDSSQDNYYGFKIDSVDLTTDELTQATEIQSYPLVSETQTMSTGVYPESAHNPYGNTNNIMYICDSGLEFPDEFYSWVEIQDEDIQTALADASTAQDTADQKRRVFVAQPVPPYDVGDLWVQGTNGDILKCITAKADGASYASADWEKASKYTDDTAANAYTDQQLSDFDQSLTQNEVLSRLVNGGDQIYLQDGHLYILASAILGQILKLGGRDNENGEFEIYDSSGARVGLWNMNGLFVGNISGTDKNPSSPNTKIGTNGAITTKSLTASDYVYVDGNTSSYFKVPCRYTGRFAEIGQWGFKVRNSSHELYAPTNDSSHKGITIRPISASETIDSVGMQLDPSQFRIFHPSNTNGSWLSATYQELTLQKGGGNGWAFNCQNWSSGWKCTIGATFTVTSGYTKSKSVDTEDYSERLLYCYETPSPMFGDIGEGTIGDDGLCYMTIDPIFAETVSLSQYQVFLQKYGEGECFVKERKPSYFVVQGEPGLSFGWEIKARQIDVPYSRLDRRETQYVENSNNDIDYVEEAANHITEIQQERVLT